jgi:hypothetical protein
MVKGLKKYNICSMTKGLNVSMKQLKGACIIGQSGGPTSVINASATAA